MFYVLDKPWISVNERTPAEGEYVDARFVFPGINDESGRPIKQHIRACYLNGLYYSGMCPLESHGAQVVEWRSYEN